MADGKCKCGRSLKDGEKLCPRCNSKKDAKTKSFLWKAGAAGLAIVAVGVTVVSKIRRGQMVSKRDLEEFKEILNTMKAGVSK